MRRRLVALIVDRSTLILLVALAIGAYAVHRLVDFESGTVNISIDSSLTGLLPVDGDSINAYRRVRDHFGGDDILIVAWFDDALFSASVLRRLKRFMRRADRVPGVLMIDGLANAIRIRNTDDGIEVDRYLRRIPSARPELDAIKDELMASPLYGERLISNDGRGALVAVHFDPDLDSEKLRRAVAEISRASREEAGAVEQFISGPVHARLEISRILFQDLRLALPFAICATALVAAMTLRNIRGVLLPLLSTGLGLVVALAIFVEFGHALNFVTAIVPPVVFVVGFGFAIHVLSEFDRTYTGEVGKKAAIEKSVEEVFTPLTLTAVTTAVGFASLATSSISSIRIFGVYTALGTVLCLGAALFVIPAILHIVPSGRKARVSHSRLVMFAPMLARFNLRHRRGILLTAMGLVVIAAFSASRLELSTDYLRNFPSDSPVQLNFERIRTEFSGAVPIQILIESDIVGAFTDPVHLANITQFEAWLEAQPEVGVAVGLTDLIAVLNHAFDPDKALTIPETQVEVEELLFLAGGATLNRFVDPRFKSILIHARTSAVSSNDLADLADRIEQRLVNMPPHLRGQVTGSSALLALTLDDIVRGQLLSLAGALLVIYIILILLFESARVAALALLPNVAPIVCFFGLLGVSGITLNLATSLVAAVVLGIAVDDSIHFLSRFNAEARRFADESEGIEQALSAVIRPVTFTTAALCCGFLTLTFGELQSQVQFGALAAATLIIAWVFDLTFTPALASQLRFVTLWEVLTVNLGEAPHKTIPFFSGLTNREARIVAILGDIESFKKNENILRLGESRSDIHVVIEGSARAYVRRDEGERLLRTLERGDLIGEVGLFHGSGTAYVDATTDIRFLRINDASLKRIQTRYPRIAAQLYRNLAVILANRLADTTERI